MVCGSRHTGGLVTMGSPSRVSAVIPFYGDPDEMLPLLDALKSQTHPPAQVIVADDASPIPFPERDGVTVMRQARNRGFGSTVNLGASAASGDLLLILNSDLTIEDGFIEELLAQSAEWQPAIISPQVREHGELAATSRRWPTARRAFFSWLTPLARLRDRSVWRRLVGHYEPASIPLEGQKVDWVVGACMLIPRMVFEVAGGFDERFHMNSEEVDLQKRMSQAGIPSVVIPKVTVDHVGGGSSDPSRRRQWLVNGLFLYFSKWGGTMRLRLALSLASVLNLVWNSVRRLRGTDVQPVAVFREELTLINRGYRARKNSARQGTPT